METHKQEETLKWALRPRSSYWTLEERVDKNKQKPKNKAKPNAYRSTAAYRKKQQMDTQIIEKNKWGELEVDKYKPLFFKFMRKIDLTIKN